MTPQQYATEQVKQIGYVPLMFEEQLHTIIANAYTAGMNADKWVSVEDGLPEVNRTVLAVQHGHYEISWVNSEDIWARDSHGDPYHPTHWQPLPLPLPPKL